MPSAIAQEKLAARARRISRLRRRIVASLLATFALAWGVVAFAGPMGAEPTTAVASTSSTTTNSATDQTTTPAPGDSASSDSSSDDGSSLTTSQS